MRQQYRRKYVGELVHQDWPLSGGRSAPSWSFMLHRMSAEHRTTMRVQRTRLEPGYNAIHTWFTQKHGAGWALQQLGAGLNAARRWLLILRLRAIRGMQ